MSAGQVNMGTKTPKRPGPIPDILMIDYNSSAGIVVWGYVIWKSVIQMLAHSFINWPSQ